MVPYLYIIREFIHHVFLLHAIRYYIVVSTHCWQYKLLYEYYYSYAALCNHTVYGRIARGFCSECTAHVWVAVITMLINTHN